MPTMARLPAITRRARQVANEHFPHDTISVLHPPFPTDDAQIPAFGPAILNRIALSAVSQLKRLMGQDHEGGSAGAG